jgi:hypothetical protein
MVLIKFKSYWLKHYLKAIYSLYNIEVIILISFEQFSSELSRCQTEEIAILNKRTD